MFGLGPVELIVIGLLAVLLMGPAMVKRAVRTFMDTRRELRELTKQVETEKKAIETEARAVLGTEPRDKKG